MQHATTNGARQRIPAVQCENGLNWAFPLIRRSQGYPQWASQAENAGSIPVARSRLTYQFRCAFFRPNGLWTTNRKWFRATFVPRRAMAHLGIRVLSFLLQSNQRRLALRLPRIARRLATRTAKCIHEGGNRPSGHRSEPDSLKLCADDRSSCWDPIVRTRCYGPFDVQPRLRNNCFTIFTACHYRCVIGMGYGEPQGWSWSWSWSWRRPWYRTRTQSPFGGSGGRFFVAFTDTSRRLPCTINPCLPSTSGEHGSLSRALHPSVVAAPPL